MENILTSFCKHHTATNKRERISRLAIKLCCWSVLKTIHRTPPIKLQLPFIASDLNESDLIRTNFGVSSTTTRKTSDEQLLSLGYKKQAFFSISEWHTQGRSQDFSRGTPDFFYIVSPSTSHSKFQHFFKVALLKVGLTSVSQSIFAVYEMTQPLKFLNSVGLLCSLTSTVYH